MNRHAPPGATRAFHGTDFNLKIVTVHGATDGNVAARTGPIAGDIFAKNGDGFGDGS